MPNDTSVCHFSSSAHVTWVGEGRPLASVPCGWCVGLAHATVKFVSGADEIVRVYRVNERQIEKTGDNTSILTKTGNNEPQRAVID